MFPFEQRIVSEKEQDYSFAGYAISEDLIEKLRLFKFEEEFTNALKMKPIHSYYFMVPTNPGEQFYMFSSLAAWLIRKSGRIFEQPQESDDPNVTISNILEVLRGNGTIIDIPPNKLKQGVGEAVVTILDHLVNHALKSASFQFQSMETPREEKEDDPEMIEDDSELILDRVEEEMMAYYTDDSDEDDLINVYDYNAKKVQETPNLLSTVDSENWMLELERVLPKLKVTIKNDARDWRTHLEQMKNYKGTIDQSLGGTKNQLDKMHKDIKFTMEKIENREKYLNRDLETILEEYRLLQDQRSKVKEAYNEISGGVTERTRQLGQLTDRLESIKMQMEERGNSMTDGTPLVNIKKAIAKVRAEVNDMDIRIGVLDCILLQSKVREKKTLEDDLSQTFISY